MTTDVTVVTPEPCWLCGGARGWEDCREQRSVVCPLCAASAPPGPAGAAAGPFPWPAQPNTAAVPGWPDRLTGYDYLEARYFGPPLPAAPTLLVIHRPARTVAVAPYMHDPGDGRKVSTHFAPRDETGDYVQCVSLYRQAWGQGGSCWEGNCRLNQVALSLECMVPMCKHWPLRSWQTDRTREILVRLYEDVPTIAAVIGHSDGDPSRRSDPGTDLPWEILVGDLAWRCPHL